MIFWATYVSNFLLWLDRLATCEPKRFNLGRYVRLGFKNRAARAIQVRLNAVYEDRAPKLNRLSISDGRASGR
jgi:hypothetical protein